MAAGDLKFFQEAKAFMIDGGWEAADDLKCAIVTNAVNPAVGTTTPALGDFTEVTNAGTYVTGGTSIGTLGNFVTQSGSTVTFDSATNPTWAQDAANSTTAYWAVVYNDTQAGDPAWFFVDLAGPVNMATGSLTVTWNASGVATLTGGE